MVQGLSQANEERQFGNPREVNRALVALRLIETLERLVENSKSVIPPKPQLLQQLHNVRHALDGYTDVDSEDGAPQ